MVYQCGIRVRDGVDSVVYVWCPYHTGIMYSGYCITVIGIRREGLEQARKEHLDREKWRFLCLDILRGSKTSEL